MTSVSTAAMAADTRPAEALAAGALSLARRFASGATMWCIAPEWPDHGRHVAVEFVHPVIMGKRALPAVYLGGADITATLRLLSRPGDVLLSVGSSGDARIADLMCRAEAWGLTRIWIGAGPSRPAVSAEHVVWVATTDPYRAARSGDLVLLYHLLWELTHVVFEHPGLVAPDPGCTEEVCITCSDEGRVAEVLSVHDASSVEVLAAGRHQTIDASLVEPVVPGDMLLVHAGVAIVSLQMAPRKIERHNSVADEA
jgi:hydrogenase maturation factor